MKVVVKIYIVYVRYVEIVSIAIRNISNYRRSSF